MSKVSVGDYVCIEYQRRNGVVIGDRGGSVGRWVIKNDNGDVSYASTRDVVVIKPAVPNYTKGLSTDEKLELLLQHLGLEIRVEPEIIQIKEIAS